MRIDSIRSVYFGQNNKAAKNRVFKGKKLDAVKSAASLVPVLGIGGTAAALTTYAAQQVKDKAINKKEELFNDLPPKTRVAHEFMEEQIKNFVTGYKEV